VKIHLSNSFFTSNLLLYRRLAFPADLGGVVVVVIAPGSCVIASWAREQLLFYGLLSMGRSSAALLRNVPGVYIMMSLSAGPWWLQGRND
jgi:hypothetical protein